MRDLVKRTCTPMAARPEAVLDFAANMSDDEVESPKGAAAEPVPEEISGECIQSSTEVRFRKNHKHLSIKASQFFKEGKSESDFQYFVCIVVASHNHKVISTNH
jgi:hypothetical protein